MTTTSKLKEEIQLIEHYCGKSGIELFYIRNGNEHHLICTPEQSADLLKAVGAIEDYQVANGEVDVTLVYDNDLTQKEALANMEWDAFTSFFKLTQSLAIEIAVLVEDRKQTDKWVCEVLSIPGLIKGIGA